MTAHLRWLSLLSLLAAGCVYRLEPFPDDIHPGDVSGIAVGVKPGTAIQVPLEGARVTVRGSSLSVTTRDDGRFYLRNLPPGTFHLGLQWPGDVAVPTTLVATAVVTVRERNGVRSALDLGQLRLGAPGVITGLVTLGEGLQGLDVTQLSVVLEGAGASAPGSDGRFTFANVAAGDWSVVAGAQGALSARTRASVTPGGTVEVELVVAQPPDMPGTVAALVLAQPTVTPLQSAAWRLLSMAGTPLDDGELLLPQLHAIVSPGLYALEIAGTGYAPLIVPGVAVLAGEVTDIGTLLLTVDGARCDQLGNCLLDAGTPDAHVADSGTMDGGPPPDAALPDASVVDSSVPDAAVTDAGEVLDAAEPPDASVVIEDAGEPVDAAMEMPDASVEMDAGCIPVDAGTPPLLNLIAWFDAQDTNIQVGDAGELVSWPDRAGQMPALVPMVGTTQTLNRASPHVCGPTVDFTAGGMETPMALWDTGQHTIFAVIVPRDVGGENDVVSTNTYTSGDGEGIMMILGSRVAAHHWTPGGNGGFLYCPTFLLDQQPYIVAQSSDSATLNAYLNGNLEGTVTLGGTPPTTLQQVTIGSRCPGCYPSGSYVGEMAEVLIYSTVLSETDRQAAESYLRARWGF